MCCTDIDIDTANIKSENAQKLDFMDAQVFAGKVQ